MMRLLFADSHSNTPFWYEEELKQRGLIFESMLAENEEQLLQASDGFQPQMILLNTILPFTRKPAFLARLYPIPTIMVLDSMDLDIVVTCMRAGAQDCVVKGEDGRLVHAVEGALQRAGAPRQPEIGDETAEVNRLLQCMMDEFPAAAFLKDRSGRLLWANRRAMRLAQNVSFEDADISAPARQSNTAGFYDLTDEQQIDRAFEVKEISFLSPDGGTDYYLSTSMPLRDVGGDIVVIASLFQDITTIKMVENDLLSSLERIKLVLDSGDVGIFDLDMVHDSIWRTYKHDQIYGYDTLQPQWKMDDFYRFVVPEDSDAVTSYMEKAVMKGHYQFECRINRLDHQERWISCQGSVFHDEKGKPVRMIGTLRDITGRKQVELSLQKRVAELEMVNRIMSQMYRGRSIRELLQVLMDEMLAAISFTDGCILLYNAEKKILEPVVTRGWFDSMKGIVFTETECISGYVFMEDEQYISDDIRNDPLVSQKFIEVIPPAQTGVYLPIHDSEGKLGVIAVACELPRRITEDEQRLLTIISRLAGTSATKTRLYEEIHYSYEELQKEVVLRKITQNLYAAEKEILSTTLMSIAEGVITTDEDGLIVLFNHAAEKILGYLAGEVLEKPVHTIMRILDTDTDKVVSNTIERLYEMDQMQLKDGLNYRSPTVLTKTDEKVLLGGSIASVKTSDGGNIGHVIIFQNITEKQIMEAQNLLSTKMEAIGQLAAGIAHEINTPVQYIGDNLSYIQRVLSKYNDMLEAYQENIMRSSGKVFTQKEIDALESLRQKHRIERYKKEAPLSIEEAMEGVQRVQKIIKAVREFSHPSQREMQMADINHGIETTVTISRNEWKYHAELEIDLDQNLPPVLCQIDEINQVILNMIVNAAQAIEEKLADRREEMGKIHIRTQKDESSDLVLITIQDNGAGIPQEIRERIFDPFFTTKGVGKGTGQGLSMAYNIIVNKHYGSIQVDSKVGEGTVFTIGLPLQSRES